jgi:hypothetical protein
LGLERRKLIIYSKRTGSFRHCVNRGVSLYLVSAYIGEAFAGKKIQKKKAHAFLRKTAW